MLLIQTSGFYGNLLLNVDVNWHVARIHRGAMFSSRSYCAKITKRRDDSNFLGHVCWTVASADVTARLNTKHCILSAYCICSFRVIVSLYSFHRLTFVNSYILRSLWGTIRNYTWHVGSLQSSKYLNSKCSTFCEFNMLCNIYYHHHHHNHVYEGLGVFPGP
jgi:hypothetical protein